MKCENNDCIHDVEPGDIERGCAGLIDHDDCTRHCSCCLNCRQECIDGSMEYAESGV